MIDSKCEYYGANETIEELINYGADRETLIEMSFQEEDIDNIFEEHKQNHIDICE